MNTDHTVQDGEKEVETSRSVNRRYATVPWTRVGLRGLKTTATLGTSLLDAKTKVMSLRTSLFIRVHPFLSVVDSSSRSNRVMTWN